MENKLFKIQGKQLWLFVVLIGFIALYPNLNNSWVNWDDQAYILQNELIRSLDFEGIQAIFTELNVVGNYHPFTVLSLAIDYAIGDLNPFVYHLHSLLLHLTNSVLVFFLVFALFREYRLSFAVAVLFSIHPMHLESLAWMSARKDLLFAFYLLLGLLCYLKYIKTDQKKLKRIYYGLCLLLFCFSLLSKSMAMVFPVYLLLFDFISNRKNTWSIWIEKLPFFILSFFFVALTLYTQSIEGAIINEVSFSILDRIVLSCTSIVMYLVKSVFPYGLSSFHPYPFQRVSDIPSYFYFSLLIIPLLGFLFWYTWKKGNRIILFGFAFFLISLAPVLQIIPYGRAMIAERYTYVAYLGLFCLLALLFEKKGKISSLVQSRLFQVIGALLIMTLGSISYVRSSVWKNGETLWSDAIESYPQDYFAYYKRAEYLMNKGDIDRALSDIDKSIRLYEHYTESLNLRGRMWIKLGEHKQAANDFAAAIEAEPYFRPPYVNIAKALSSLGKFELALEYLNSGINLHPNYTIAFINRGAIQERLGLAEEALSDYSKAIEIGPSNGTAYRYRAVLYLSQGDAQLAIKDFTQALEHSPSDGLSYFLRAKAYQELGTLEKAISDARKAKDLNYTEADKLLTELLNAS